MPSTPSFSGSIPRMYEEILGPVYFEPYAEDIARRVAHLNPLAVLETACGTGRVTNHLRQQIPPECSFVATDINADMLAVAKEKLNNLGGILWLQADGQQVPFDNGSFDALVCQFGIMFYPDKLQGMKESFRLLKFSGTFLFTVWDKLDTNPFAAAGRQVFMDFFNQEPPEYLRTPFMFNNPKEIIPMLEAAGFRHVKYETLVKPLVAPSAELVTEGMVEGSPVIHAIREKDPAAVPMIKKNIRDTLIQKFGDHPCRSEMQAILFTAKKN